jgi:hypothetical protein
MLFRFVKFIYLTAVLQLSLKKAIIRDFLYRSKSLLDCLAPRSSQ